MEIEEFWRFVLACEQFEIAWERALKKESTGWRQKENGVWYHDDTWRFEPKVNDGD